MADRGDDFSFSRDIHITNGQYLYFHKTYGHQDCTTGTSGEVQSLENNQGATGDVITLISRDLKKCYNSL